MLVPGKHLALVLALCDNVDLTVMVQILKPAEKKQKYVYGGQGTGGPVTPPRKQKKK
jgi:hypothetical protein